MMDDVFIYHAHMFFVLLCACVGYLDLVSTSTSRELTIRAPESEPPSTTTTLHHTCLCFGIVKDAQGHAFKVIYFSLEKPKTMSMNIVDHTTCVACTLRLICHLGPLYYAHVSDIAFIQDRHFSMYHDKYALCVASNSWISCPYDMFGCNNVNFSHMSCPITCHMIDLIASHMMNNFSFYCVECHTIFSTPHAHYAWIVLHFTHVFRHFILLGVVNDSYAYHRPFVERFMHDRYDREVDASSLVTHICITKSHLHACFHDVLLCAQFMCLHAMSQSFVTPYAMLDDNTCWVNHLLNAWFCTNANRICFSKCLFSLLLLQESRDGATLESAHFKLQDDENLVIDHFYTTTPSLSHGDLDFDLRSDLSQGGGDDVEHPTDITMSRVHSASDTCDIYLTYTKVNHILYTCSLDPLEDGILLDTPPVCMHRYCRSFMNVEEECKHQGTTTPSAREAWKRRKKKRGQLSGKPGTSSRCPELPASGTSGHSGASGPAAPKPSKSVPTLWIARTFAWNLRRPDLPAVPRTFGPACV